MKRLFLALVPTLIMSLPAHADEVKRYKECVHDALNNPVETFVIATAWRDEGGGVPAEHCLGLVLTALERYEAAATQLERVAKHIKAGAGVNPFIMEITPALRAEIWAQAGNAWLLAGRGGDAYEAFTRALEESDAGAPGNAEILIDRARTTAVLGDYEAAIADLDQALQIAAERGDIYLYRAALKRRLNDLSQAKADIENALQYIKDDPDVFLEAGNIAAAQGDFDMARQHWLQVVQLATEGAAVDAAQANLAELDIHRPSGE